MISQSALGKGWVKSLVRLSDDRQVLAFIAIACTARQNRQQRTDPWRSRRSGPLGRYRPLDAALGRQRLEPRQRLDPRNAGRGIDRNSDGNFHTHTTGSASWATLSTSALPVDVAQLASRKNIPE